MDSKLIKHKALLLKDYLLDDMSSCSSNGFKSFPRKQGCTSTVRFLIEIDLKQHKKYLIFNNRNPSKFAFSSVIAALKKSILPPNLSKKILNKTIFWKTKSNRNQIQRWKSFDQLLKEDSQPLDIPNSLTTPDVCSSGNSSSSSQVNLNFTEVKSDDADDDDDVEVLKNGDVSADSASSSDGSATRSSTTQKQWAVGGDKEQFSPVSVLDCPFDDDEEVSSPFQRMEGTTKKLMGKMKRFGCLDQLEHLNLAKCFALLPDSDNESTGSPLPHSSASVARSSITEGEDDTNRADQKALDLLHQFMASYGLKIKADKLVLDFFREKILGKNLHSFEEEVVLEEAESWMCGRKSGDSFLGWEVPRNRQAYINDMEKWGEWKCLEHEIWELSLEMEAAVFDALFDELVVDISSTTTV